MAEAALAVQKTIAVILEHEQTSVIHLCNNQSLSPAAGGPLQTGIGMDGAAQQSQQSMTLLILICIC